MNHPLTRPSGTLSPAEGERDGVRGRFKGSGRMLSAGGSCLGPFIDGVNALFSRFRVR